MSDIGQILIADDDATFLFATADLLRREGFECDCATNAKEVVDILSLVKFDLLISDINMPGNNELELIKKLPEIAEGLPVILLTGSLCSYTQIQSLKPPVTVCLDKPVDFEELLMHVRSSIRR